MTLRLSFAANEKFVEDLDHAVSQYRNANPRRAVTRSTFMRDAIEHAMTSAGAGSSSASRVRTRERSGAVA